MNIDWMKTFGAAITVCDREGKIHEMNDRSIQNFVKDGGADLIGRNVLDCHPEPARTKLAEMMREGRINVYTTEKRGQKKLVYQAPWEDETGGQGFVEIIIDLPADMPHFVRE